MSTESRNSKGSQAMQPGLGLWMAFGLAISLTMPWMVFPLVYGATTKRWTWWDRWLAWTLDKQC